MDIQEILEKFPLRVALTDFCNLRCFFCSNEGMDLSCRNLRNIDFKKLEYLLRLLKKNGLRGLSLTGGEPSLYPQIDQLLTLVEELGFEQTFYHTNGTHLTPELIHKHLKNFSKVAVSIHTVDFEVWNELTRGPRVLFDKLMSNLDVLAEYAKRKDLLVEIKVVPMRGVNSGQEIVKGVLDFCNDRNFKFKFLNFEPITADQMKYQTSLQDLVDSIEALGAGKLPSDGTFRGQDSYLPFNWYKYKDVKGVLIEIGCGQTEVCKNCFKSNEIFVDPGLELKPCHATIKSFPLKDLIEKHQDDKILAAVVESRNYLKTQPGKGKKMWGN